MGKCKVLWSRHIHWFRWAITSASLPLLSGGDNETDGVTFSSNLAVRFDKDVDEPEVDDDSLNVTIK